MRPTDFGTLKETIMSRTLRATTALLGLACIAAGCSGPAVTAEPVQPEQAVAASANEELFDTGDRATNPGSQAVSPAAQPAAPTQTVTVQAPTATATTPALVPVVTVTETAVPTPTVTVTQQAAPAPAPNPTVTVFEKQVQVPQAVVTTKYVEPPAIYTGYGSSTRTTANLMLHRIWGCGDSDVIVKMPKGATVTVYQEDGGWYWVSYRGMEGWASGRFLAGIGSGPTCGK
jgi:hypothetical protein